jgi:hypothetical protein
MRRLGVASLLLFLAVLIAYLANGRTIGAGDTLPAAYLPWSLIREGNFDLDEFPILHDETARRIYPLLDGIPYYLQYRNGHYLSAYTPGPGVLALPVYLVPVMLGVKADSAWAAYLEKLSAAIITALSVVFLYWALLGVTTRGWALVIALVYALGTSSLSMSSQALWQHGPSQLCLSLALYFLVRGLAEDRFLGYAGLPMAAAVVMRSTDLLLVLPVAAWIVWAHRRRALTLVLWALPPAVALAVYYAVYFGTPDHGPGHTTAPVWALFAGMPLREGLPGLLLSPSRGLFVYSPVLLFSVAGMIAVWRRGPALWRALSLGPPMVVLLISKWIIWWGGHSWGPRLLADLDPILCFFLYPVFSCLDRRRLVKAVFVALALWSVAAHALGAWLYDRHWDALAAEGSQARLWPWSGSPLAFYGREALGRLGLAGSWTRSGRRASDSPGSLAASYEVGPVPAEVMSGERFVVSLSAANIGGEVWQPAAPGDHGAVRLGWRWYRGDQEVAAGHEILLSGVAPGQAAELRARIIAPVEPGEYTLELGIVSEKVAWFGEPGQKPLRFPVRVLPLEVRRMLAEPTGRTAPAPVATIVTDRSSYRGGDRLQLAVALAYPHHPRAFDAYLILEPPAGPPLFFDGHAMPRPGDGGWPRWVKGLPLPARVNGRFTLPLSSLPPGAYRWHVVLTEPGAYHALARADAAFRIEP